MMEKLIVFVEEFSMEAALERLLPNLIGDLEYQIIRFQCKDDLLKQAPIRLRAYASWLPEGWRILVLVDRDDDNCVALKAILEQMAAAAGLRTKTAAGIGRRFQVVNRIAIEELESWFFGDWQAVQAAYPRVPATIPQKASFRDPDAIAGGTWEALSEFSRKRAISALAYASWSWLAPLPARWSLTGITREVFRHLPMPLRRPWCDAGWSFGSPLGLCRPRVLPLLAVALLRPILGVAIVGKA